MKEEVKLSQEEFISQSVKWLNEHQGSKIESVEFFMSFPRRLFEIYPAEATTFLLESFENKLKETNEEIKKKNLPFKE